MSTASRQTPGVFIQDIDAFPPSITGVPTAVPAFAGYTEKAEVDGKSVTLQPTKISSLADFQQIFGGAPSDGTFHLYAGLQLFYANGGAEAYVVSVGDYAGPVSLDALQKGLEALAHQPRSTMLAIPDAVRLPADDEPIPGTKLPKSSAFATLTQAMLAQAGTLQDRVAILDVYGTDHLPDVQAPDFEDQLSALIAQFRQDVGSEYLSYGAAYFPYLQTSDATGEARLQPPSAAMAGVFTQIDHTRGVWSAPANVAVASVQAPSVPLTEAQQGDLNAPADGKAVDVIRDFPGRGSVVWGARTLDGNSPDYRYVQVRRTLIYIEQSIQAALDPFVFAANDGKTWKAVKSMVSSFLQQLWQQGGLMGATASEAFTVEVGLGSTMTAQDILDGYMIVQVTLQMIRPAEFIELTFKQKMEGVG